jgi:hypothetical protein
MKNKAMLLIPILIGIMFVLPTVSAGAAAWFNMTLPAWANVTTGTNNVSFTVSVAAIYNVTNVSCYYNLSGGASYPGSNATFLGTDINGSNGDTSFTITGTLGTAATRLANISCILFNESTSVGKVELEGGNSSVDAMNVTVDGTAPVLTLGLDTTNIGTRTAVLMKWTVTDSGSRLRNVSVIVTSPDSQKCPNYPVVNGTLDSIALTSYSPIQAVIQNEQTMCAGDYTVNLTASDYSGNLNSNTIVFRASVQGKKDGGNTLGGTTGGPGENLGNFESSSLPLGEQGTNIAIILVIAGAAYLFFKRKK